ncbi:hemolysin family protein [Luteimicrobium sp. NPDC057192]|uniref:hemolysin family protein n=1 Tax=Luteimicrobium sp. NPDC057192 TaxID=3346042 RepID=UPI0036334209
MNGEPVWLLVLIAVAGILLAAALSAGETAVLRQGSLSAHARESAGGRDEDTDDVRSRRVAALLEDARGVAASASFLRVLAEMTATACITLAVGAWLEPWWAVLLVSLVVSAVVAVGLVRLSPRSLGRTHAPAVLRALSGLLRAVVVGTRWLSPLVQPPPPTPEEEAAELRELARRAGESDAFEDDDRELLRSVFELGDTMVREVMVPRPDMVTVAGTATLQKALRLFLRSGYSRVPVVGRSTDDLLGVLYFKDVTRLVTDGNGGGQRLARDAARPAVFVPESKPVDDLLREMQAAASHIAIVVDEYGGIAGLVTIEDALEEIVGELTDEHDHTGPEVEDLGDGRYRVPARLALDDLGDLFGLRIDDDDVDTAAGLLAKALGKVPLAGSSAETHGLHLVADRVEGRRRRLATLVVGRAERSESDEHDHQAAAAAPAQPSREDTHDHR